MKRLLPHPLLSLTILALWMLLASNISVGNFLLGGLLAVLIPRIMIGFWPERSFMSHPMTAVRLACVFLADIVTANLTVARLVLGPIDRLKSEFVEIPLDTHDVFVSTLLGCIVALTPGTVSVDIDRDRWVLLVHALHVEDTQSLINTIKSRYEAPLREIFAC
ncbi:Na+/H+ antiporter subunit E [Leptospira interrogans]